MPRKSASPPRLLTLGRADLVRGDQRIALRRKDLGLLVYLVLERRVHRRSALAALLWAESSEEDARHSLTQALSRLRRELGEGVVRSGRETVEWMQPPACDALELEALAIDGQPRPLEVYGGEFLAGFHPGKDARGFEDWMETRRAGYRAQAAGLLERWGEAAEESGDAAGALRLAQRLAEVDFYRETAHRRIMRMLGAGGEAGQALRHYEAFAERLHREMELAPQEATRALAEQLRAGAPSLARETPAPARQEPEVRALAAASAPEDAGEAVPKEPVSAADPPDDRASPEIAEVLDRPSVAVERRAANGSSPRGGGGGRRTRRRGFVLGTALLAGAGAGVLLLFPRETPATGIGLRAAGEHGCAPGEAVARFAGETFPDNVPVAPGERFTKQWTLRNTGNCVWTEAFSLHFESADVPMALARRRVPLPRQVPPGDTVNIQLPMRAPDRPGLYREDWSLRDPERAIVPVSSSNTIWTRIIVPAPGAPPCTADNAVAKFASESHPDDTVLPAGGPFTKRWTLRNGGHCTWPADFALHYAASRTGRLGTETRIPLGRPVAPGETHEFVVPMRVPARAGTYREDWSFHDARGDTIRVSGSRTIWAQVVADPLHRAPEQEDRDGTGGR